MIETLYRTDTPEKGRSEFYVLVLTARPASHGRVYTFMEEHGYWDDHLERVLHEVVSISAEGDLNHEQALTMYDASRKRLAQRGFVHSFVRGCRSKAPHADQPSELETASA